jgi:hypothetical protein
MKVREICIVAVLIGVFGIILATCMTGCTVLQTSDPNTGEVTNTYAVDPNATAVVETAAEVAAGLLPLAGGVGVAIASALTGALAAWRKVKPSLTTAKTAAAQTEATAAALVTAIEAFKAINPDMWDQLGSLISDQLTKQGVNVEIIKSVINGLRASATTAT